MDSRVYKRAAKILVEDVEYYSCYAIQTAANTGNVGRFFNCDYVNKYREYFNPHWPSLDSVTLVSMDIDWWGAFKPYKLERSLALLLMAEIIKDES